MTGPKPTLGKVNVPRTGPRAGASSGGAKATVTPAGKAIWAKKYDPKAIIAYIKTTNFSAREIAEVQEAFNDVAINGSLDKLAFKEALGVLGSTNPHLTGALFKYFDRNGNGLIDENEFVLSMSVLTKGSAEDKLKLAFATYDTSGNGSISRRELHQAIKNQVVGGTKLLMTLLTLEAEANRTGKDINSIDPRAIKIRKSDLPIKLEDIKPLVNDAFNRYDKDKNGRITLEEFMLWAKDEPRLTDTMAVLHGSDAPWMSLNPKMDKAGNRESAPPPLKSSTEQENPAVKTPSKADRQRARGGGAATAGAVQTSPPRVRSSSKNKRASMGSVSKPKAPRPPSVVAGDTVKKPGASMRIMPGAVSKGAKQWPPPPNSTPMMEYESVKKIKERTASAPKPAGKFNRAAAASVTSKSKSKPAAPAAPKKKSPPKAAPKKMAIVADSDSDDDSDESPYQSFREPADAAKPPAPAAPSKADKRLSGVSMKSDASAGSFSSAEESVRKPKKEEKKKPAAPAPPKAAPKVEDDDEEEEEWIIEEEEIWELEEEDESDGSYEEESDDEEEE